MSRLDHFIARMVSQRACIDFGVTATRHLTGPVLELGLGNGRTYDHLRSRVRARDIFVFERAIASHPDSTPPEDRLILGEIRESLPAALTRFGASASLIHADLGGHDPAMNDAFARELSPMVAPLLAPGGLMIASDRMYFDTLDPVDLPEGAISDRCFIYRRAD